MFYVPLYGTLKAGKFLLDYSMIETVFEVGKGALVLLFFFEVGRIVGHYPVMGAGLMAGAVVIGLISVSVMYGFSVTDFFMFLIFSAISCLLFLTLTHLVTGIVFLGGF